MLATVVFALLVSCGLFFLGIKNNNYTFWRVILVFLIFLNIVFDYFTIDVSFGLLLGPILWRLQRIAINKQIHQLAWFGHLIPFVCLSMFDTKESFFLIALACSLIIYCCLVWKHDHKIEYDFSRKQTISRLALIGFAAFGVVIICVLLIYRIVFPGEIGLNIQVWAFALRCLVIGILAVDIYNSIRRKSLSESPIESGISEDALELYASQLEASLEFKKLHLRSSLSLGDLSKELRIPKYRLSQLFNLYYNKPYYQYIAERRINDAITMLESEPNATLESIAYDCGFNSKTTFNKYFKDIIGETPSEYRARIKQ